MLKMLMRDEREAWNERYRKGSHSTVEPDSFLVESYAEFITPLLPNAGSALDLAGGIGRHAIWLVQRGWQVRLADILEVGVEHARDHAGVLKEKIEFRIEDVSNFKAGKTRYDLILVFFYLQREIFPELVKTLRLGGLLLYKTYTRLHPKLGRGQIHPMHLLKENELLTASPGLTVLDYHETVHSRGVAEFVGRKK